MKNNLKEIFVSPTVEIIKMTAEDNDIITTSVQLEEFHINESGELII